MKRIFWAIVFGVVGAVVTAVPAWAVSADGKQFIGGDNTFYAYVRAGETVDVSFLRAAHSEMIFTVQGDVTITIDGPGMEQQKCVAARDVALGQGCRFAGIKVAQTGVWKIQFTPPESAAVFEEVAPSVRWGKNLFSWDVTVKSSEGERKGRVWTEQYALRQPPEVQYNTDLEHYYVSEDGYIYKATSRGYNGQISMLAADGVGLRKNKTCESAYQSAEVSNTKLSPAYGECGSTYKLFFEEPAGELPAQAKRWDGKAEWIRPTIKRPAVSELHFISDDSTDQQSGKISYYLRHFVGQYQVKIDVDNDGSFDGQNDVTLHQHMQRLSNGLQSVVFDGVDKSGQIIPPSQPIGVKVEIARVAEIHFVATDVEVRSGGIELTRLNGENAPTTRVCWNDTELTPIGAALMPQLIDGRECPESTGGVHGWAYGEVSWGNARYIDNWVYATARLDGKATIVYPEEEIIEANTVSGNGAMVVIVGVLVGSVVVGGIVFVVIKRRKTAQLKNMQLPHSQYPPTYPSQQQPGVPPVPPMPQSPQNPDVQHPRDNGIQ